MKVLITGAQGQVGQEVALHCKSQGFEVYAYSSEEWDITRADLGSPIEKMDALINCAAYTAVDRAEDDAEKAFLVNAKGVETLALWCKQHAIPLIHLSTDYVFDGKKEGAYFETDHPAPQSVYGESKLAGEAALQAIWDQHIILRVSWVFGRFGHNFVKTIKRLASEREELKVVSDQYGCPTGASHIANVIAKLLTHPALPDNWGLYHYTDAPVTTWFEFAKTFAPATCRILPITTADYPVKAKRPFNSVMNCEKIARVFGIKQALWQDELKRMET